ncbi:MAG: hypothetical protein KAI79_15990 [Bacteroidales bacterium]|nr:hypothetical protein [Bacteroidales bacterium]
MRNDILGKLGERLFGGWCIAAEYVVNSSTEYDATGWDFKIEPSQLIVNNSMFELNPENAYSHSVIDIQVKTTETNANKWSISFEHLIRFAHSTYPAFLCIIQIKPNTDEVEKVYLIHIDEKHIKEILKKQRKLASKAKDIHNKTLTIKSQPSDIISSNFSINIKKRLDEVLEQGNRYTTNKQKTLKTVGYDEVGANIKFSARLDKIVNTSLGINESLSVDDFLIEDLRFDIPMSQDIGPGKLMIEPEEKDAIIIVSCPNKNQIQFLVKARMSPFYDKDLSKLPFASFLHKSFIISMFKDNMTISPKSPEQISLKNLKDFIILYNSIKNGCKFEINLNNYMLPTSINGIDKSYEKFENILWFCNFAIKHGFGDIEPSIEQLISQEDILLFIYNVTHKNAKHLISMVFDLHDSITGETHLNKDFRFPFVLLIKLGDIVLVLVFSVKNLDWEFKDKNMSFNINSKFENIEYFGSFNIDTSDITKFDTLYSTKAMEYLPKDENIQYIMNGNHMYKYFSSNIYASNKKIFHIDEE